MEGGCPPFTYFPIQCRRRFRRSVRSPHLGFRLDFFVLVQSSSAGSLLVSLVGIFVCYPCDSADQDARQGFRAVRSLANVHAVAWMWRFRHVFCRFLPLSLRAYFDGISSSCCEEAV